ncbi:MAG: site-specific integrase [Candidatus Brocadiia bacterium]|nr:site-specific integrase [Candidatus Brocadiia bacterium]
MPIDIWWYESRKCWCADVPCENGRKRLYLGPSEVKARSELHRYMAQYYDSLDSAAADSRPVWKRGAHSISLIALAVRFLKWNEANRANGTWRGYRDGLKHITRRHKDKLACELTASDVEAVKQEMIDGGYAARTMNIMVTAIKRLYNWGVKQGLLADNPLKGLEHVSKHVNAPARPPEKHLALDRALKCIGICRESPPLGEMCEFMLLTGMRVGEVVRLTWGDIDFQQQTLRLERHKTSGFTGRPRTIPLCARAMEILRGVAIENAEADESIFRGRDAQAFTVGALHLRLRRLRKKHPELKGFSFHKLRHTCATYLARLKVPERVAQAILGHSSTLMTRYYTATCERRSKSAAGVGPKVQHLCHVYPVA